MRAPLDELPEGDWWMCEDCKKSERKKGKSQVKVKLEPSSSAPPKSKSFPDWNRQIGVSTRSCSSASRHAVQLEALSLQEERVTKMSAKSSGNTPLQHKDLSYKTFQNGKATETKDTTSELQISCNPQDKAKASHASSDKRCDDTLQDDLVRKAKALEASANFSKPSKPTKEAQLIRESLSENLGKANVEQSPYVSQEKPKSHCHSGKELLTLG